MRLGVWRRLVECYENCVRQVDVHTTFICNEPLGTFLAEDLSPLQSSLFGVTHLICEIEFVVRHLSTRFVKLLRGRRVSE